jgi:hypothetical protein
VARYGDGWEHNYPQGCRNPFELLYFMVHGRLPIVRQSEVNRQVQAWYVDQFPPDRVDCLFHEFAEMFVRELVLAIRQSSAFPEVTQHRELRGVRLREPYPTADA